MSEPLTAGKRILAAAAVESTVGILQRLDLLAHAGLARVHRGHDDAGAEEPYEGGQLGERRVLRVRDGVN